MTTGAGGQELCEAYLQVAVLSKDLLAIGYKRSDEDSSLSVCAASCNRQGSAYLARWMRWMSTCHVQGSPGPRSYPRFSHQEARGHSGPPLLHVAHRPQAGVSMR